MSKHNEKLAPISASEIYPLSIFMERCGLGAKAMRVARKNGLYVGQVGTRRFITGADF